MKKVLSIICALNLFVAVSAFAVDEVKTAPAAAPKVEAAPAPAVVPATTPVCSDEKVITSCGKFAKHAKWKTKVEKKHGCTCPVIAKKVKVEGEKKVHAVKKHVKAEVAPKVEKTEAAPVAEEKAGE